MEKAQNLTSKGEKRAIVLLAALDWGLGHASRCIPIIYELLSRNCEVILACSGSQNAFWRQEFPGLRYVEIPAYNIEYGHKAWSTVLALLKQIPKILISIKREKAWLDDFLKKEPLDFIISDNRYGLHHKSVSSVFITHQLALANPLMRVLGGFQTKLHSRFFRSFDFCWIPDFKEEPGLAGRLSHPHMQLPIQLQYVGPLSRFKSLERPKDLDLLIILSGPEPQRSILERKMLDSLNSYTGKVVLVRGLPGGPEIPAPALKFPAYNSLPAAELNELICRAHLVVCRSGYSSIMDIITTSAKSIMIPTPGQFEQQYLATRLYADKLIYSIPQHLFDLEQALHEASTFGYRKWSRTPDESCLKKAVEKLLESKQHQP